MSVSPRLQDVLDEAESKPVGPERMERTSDSAHIETNSVGPITDWSPILAKWGLDPASWEVVDDTVKCSTWQQSKRLEDGTRDVVDLFAYSARFRKKNDKAWTDEALRDLLDEAKRWDIHPPLPRNPTGTPVGLVVNLSDIQGGKSEGGGVRATRKRLHDGLANVVEFIREQEALGRFIAEIVIVNNGDPFEGCAGNYENQLFSVELNLRQQMNFVLDTWLMYAKTLYPLAPKGQFVSVLCNHTELGRMGGRKTQTNDADSGGAFLAEAMERVLGENDAFDHVDWVIPDDEMIVYTDVQGIPMAFTHGHKIPGNDASGFEKWLNGQVRTDPRAHRAKVWITAHRHHFASWDMGSQWVFQTPSLDGGSKWLKDMTGRWSNSGILALTVGQALPHGWRDAVFL